jgi:hypothetical protein
MKPLKPNTSQANITQRTPMYPRESYSPSLLDNKTADKHKTFYTPSISSKDHRVDPYHNNYLSSKYASKGMAFEERLSSLASNYAEKPGFSTNSIRMKASDKENQEPFNSGKLINEVDNKKISKIRALFHKEKFEETNHEAVVQQWFQLNALFEVIASRRTIPNEIYEILNTYNLHAIEKFVNSFTNYNEVRSRLLTHFKLEVWTMLTLMTLRSECQKEDLKQICSPLINAIQFLIKSCYYVSLIIVKAVKHGCVSINCSSIDAFSKAVQRYNFETGIPLIKTLKTNNDSCMSILGQTFFN